MGILVEPLRFVKSLPLEPGFSVCELGDQYITFVEPHLLARVWYERDMKCGRYESIDGNGRGTILADLNRPLIPWPGEFDLVTDFGTGEHVFNQYQVFKTLHDLTKVGGYIAFDRPTQGYAVHCYWNANECVWQDVAAANGYDIIEFDTLETKRGRLFRGVFKKTFSAKFTTPHQGRYKKLLRPITGGAR